MDSIRLSPAAQNVLTKAAEESGRLEHHFLGVEHVFMVLCSDQNVPLAEGFKSQNLDLTEFCTTLGHRVRTIKQRPWGAEILFTPRCREVLTLAARVAARYHSYHVSELHILEAIFREGRTRTAPS